MINCTIKKNSKCSMRRVKTLKWFHAHDQLKSWIRQEINVIRIYFWRMNKNFERMNHFYFHSSEPNVSFGIKFIRKKKTHIIGIFLLIQAFIISHSTCICILLMIRRINIYFSIWVCFTLYGMTIAVGSHLFHTFNSNSFHLDSEILSFVLSFTALSV